MINVTTYPPQIKVYLTSRQTIVGERWRPVMGHENRYAISDLGRVYSVRSGLMSPGTQQGGHQTVCLSKKRINKNVHVLVLEAFIGKCPAGLECRHLDGDPSNNKLSNIAWGTRSKNALDRKWHGVTGRLTIDQISYIKRALKRPYLGIYVDLAKQFNVGQPTITKIKQGRIHADVSPDGKRLHA